MKATVIAEKAGKCSWNDGGVVYSRTFDNYRDAKSHYEDICIAESTPNGIPCNCIFLDIIVELED